MEIVKIFGAVALYVLGSFCGAVIAGRVCGFNGDLPKEGGEKSA